MAQERSHYLYAEEEIDLQYHLSLLRRHIKVIFAMGVIAGALVSIYAFKLPDIYEAQCQLIIQKPQQEATAYDELRTEEGAREDVFYNTQAEILRSGQLIENTLRDNHLVEPVLASRKKIFPEGTHERVKLQEAVEIAAQDLNVRQVKTTQIFNISFRSSNPVLAREMSNATAKTFMKQTLEQQLQIPREILQLFPENEENIQLQTAFGKLEEISPEQLAGTLPSVVNDPLIRQLRTKEAEAEAELKRLRETFKERHPKIVEAKSNLVFIQDRIRNETENIVKNIKTSLASKLQLQNVRIFRQASLPVQPVGPARLIIIPAGIAGALCIVFFIILVLDYFDDTVKSQEDIEKLVQLPFLGLVPLFKEKSKEGGEKSFFVQLNPLSDISESFRLIKVAINFSGPASSLKCLLVTSTIPSEGKSLFSTNLAASFVADGEKVLLVDSDLRHPTVHVNAQLQNTKGLTNYLTSNIPLEEVTQKTRINGLDVITSGPLSPNPMELFSSFRMEGFLKEVKQKYDRVIIDAPPLTGLADSLVIGTKVDGTVFVVSSRQVSRNLVKKAKQKLHETGVKVLGVVLNRVDVDREEPSYRYYTYAQRFYGKKDSKEQKLPQD